MKIEINELAPCSIESSSLSIPHSTYINRYLQGEERETAEHKLKILKREFKHMIRKLTVINNFVFADPHKKEAHAHCTHLQIAQAITQPKFAKECNLPNAQIPLTYD